MKEALAQALDALVYISHSYEIEQVEAAIEALQAALAAPQEPVVPAGWVLVPAEATPEMIAALLERTRFDNSWLPAYRAMLAASPAAPARAEPTEEQIKLLDPWMRPAAAKELLTQVLALRDGGAA